MQFSLWGSALLVEVLGHAFTPDDSKDNLRGCGSISSRLSTLTVIVLGEGQVTDSFLVNVIADYSFGWPRSKRILQYVATLRKQHWVWPQVNHIGELYTSSWHDRTP